MVKLLKCKQHFKEYGRSVLAGGLVVLTLIALASLIHHFLALSIIFILIFLSVYILGRST